MTKPHSKEDKTRIRRQTQRVKNIPKRYQASVVIVRGYAEGMEYPLSKESTVIGRDKNADIVLKDPLVSREHMVVVFHDGAFLLRDLDSTNGTVLNGTLIEQAGLRHRDKFCIGDSILQFILEDTGVGTTFEIR